MSLGPTSQEQAVQFGPVQKTVYLAKKITAAYFNRPLHYLFYGLLLGMSVSLFAGRGLPWQLYLLLFVLGAFKIVQHFKTNNLNLFLLLDEFHHFFSRPIIPKKLKSKKKS